MEAHKSNRLKAILKDPFLKAQMDEGFRRQYEMTLEQCRKNPVIIRDRDGNVISHGYMDYVRSPLG